MLSLAIISDEKLPVPPVRGGATQTILYQQSKSLIPKFRVTVYSKDDPSLLRIHEEHGIQYVHISQTGIIPYGFRFLHKLRAINPYWESPFYAGEYTTQIGLRLIAAKPDIVYIHNRPQFVWLLKQFVPHAKFVLHMHNRHLAGLSPKALQRIIPRLDLVVCCSRYIAGEIAEKIPPLTDKVKVIYNSVDIDQLRPRLNHLKIRKFRDIRIDPEYQKAVLYAGRLTPEKGIHCLVEAMKEVIRIHPEAVLIICGSSWFGSNVKDSYVAKLEELSQSLGKNIIFTGFVSPVEMPQVYTLADVFVGPSLCEEALGLVFLEAGAAGLPVIASRRGGIPEIVRDGINGILIDNPEDMPLLADKICYLLDNPETANTLGQQGRLFVEQNACLPIVTEKLLKLLDMVAGESL